MVPSRLVYCPYTPSTHTWERVWSERTGKCLIDRTYAVDDLSSIVPGVQVVSENRHVLTTRDMGGGIMRATLRRNTGGLYDDSVCLVSEAWYTAALKGNALYQEARERFISRAGALLMGYSPYASPEEHDQFHAEMERLVAEYGYTYPVNFAEEIPEFHCRLDHYQYRLSNTCTVRHYSWGVWDGESITDIPTERRRT